MAQAHEIVASVCRVLAEELSADALRSMREALPASIGNMLGPVATTPSRVAPQWHDHTLASGKSGSARPLSETGTDLRHTHSIGAENPHGATKLSTTGGSTQERRHESLADGHLDPHRSLSRSRR